MSDFDTSERQRWMGVLAKADPAQLARVWNAAALAPDHTLLRAPEIGAVMVRGRTGATGSPFNLGEMTVTRCAVQLAEGPVGHGYVQGRNKAHARTAALVDALMQTAAAPTVRARIVAPLADAQAQKKATRAAKAAATKVEFFTLVRGED